MLIYNVTTNIDDSVHDEWLIWMKQSHIPDILATGKFLNARMAKVLVAEETGGTTYSVQFGVVDSETLERYYEQDAPRLREDAHRLFPGKFVSFRTELEVVSDQQIHKPAATHYVFAYGTLQESEVQESLFARTLTGKQDVLSNFKHSDHKVAGIYPTIASSQDAQDAVTGMVYALTHDELLRADAYEGNAYHRIEVVLTSGTKAWVYVGK